MTCLDAQFEQKLMGILVAPSEAEAIADRGPSYKTKSCSDKSHSNTNADH